MVTTSCHMVDLREDRSPWDLLLEQKVAVSLQIIACFSHLCATHNSAWDVLLAPALLQPCSHLIRIAFFLEKLEVGSSLAVNILGMPLAPEQSWSYPG